MCDSEKKISCGPSCSMNCYHVTISRKLDSSVDLSKFEFLSCCGANKVYDKQGRLSGFVVVVTGDSLSRMLHFIESTIHDCAYVSTVAIGGEVIIF